MKIDEGMSPRIWDEFKQSQMTHNEDGSFTVKAVLPDDEWGYGYIMSYGAYAKVLTPSYIREIIGKRF